MLLELGKTSLEAQFANAQYNNFTGLIAAKVKTYHLEGKVIFLTHHMSWYAILLPYTCQ